ncbi:MAG TPA: hypothetical protein VLR93_09600 [Patescibacteria group bacterium]|nr:hypothetical protein [Patescibacteria group bacterium]
MTQPTDPRFDGGYGPVQAPVEPPDDLDDGPRRPLITPLRVTLTIALAASIGVVVYGLVVRDASQMPALVVGQFLTGIVFVLLALAGAWAAFSRARDGEGFKALLYALLGGICVLLGAGALAAAIILTLTLRK